MQAQPKCFGPQAKIISSQGRLRMQSSMQQHRLSAVNTRMMVQHKTSGINQTLKKVTAK